MDQIEKNALSRMMADPAIEQRMEGPAFVITRTPALTNADLVAELETLIPATDVAEFDTSDIDGFAARYSDGNVRHLVVQTARHIQDRLQARDSGLPMPDDPVGQLLKRQRKTRRAS